MLSYNQHHHHHHQRSGSVRGEDVPYALGLPISPLFPHNYTKQDIKISRMMVQYLSNFAHTGYVAIRPHGGARHINTYTHLVEFRVENRRLNNPFVSIIFIFSVFFFSFRTGTRMKRHPHPYTYRIYLSIIILHHRLSSQRAN